MYTYLDLAYFGGHSWYLLLPPLSPSQPIIADGEMIFSGSVPRLFFCYPFLFYVLFLVFCFKTFLLLTPRRHEQSFDSHSIYIPQAHQNSLQSALHSAAK